MSWVGIHTLLETTPGWKDWPLMLGVAVAMWGALAPMPAWAPRLVGRVARLGRARPQREGS